MNRTRDDLAAVRVGQHIYAIGGNCHEGTPGCDHFFTGSNTVEKAEINLNGSLSAWQNETSTICERIGSSAVSIGNFIYALGGLNIGSVCPTFTPGTVERAEVQPGGSLGAWELVNHMATLRYSQAAVVANGYAYAIGGIQQFESGPDEYLKNVERAKINPDNSLGNWEILPSEMNLVRLSPSAVVSGNYIYVLGGSIDPDPQLQLSVERAQINPDGSLGSWEVMSSMITNRLAFAAVENNNILYALGGTNQNGSQNTTEKAVVETPQPKLTNLSPAQIWIGLKNSDDVGVKFDLLAEAYKDSTLISSGQINSVSGGSSGFNNANLQTIPFNPFSPVDFPSGSALSVKVYVRNACTSSGHNSGFARLWYNDNTANSRFGATIDASSNTYYLLNNLILSSSVGTGPKKTIDVQSGTKCSPFKPFGIWTITP